MNEKETFGEKYVSRELRQKIIDDLRLKEENFWWLKTKGRKLMYYNNGISKNKLVRQCTKSTN